MRERTIILAVFFAALVMVSTALGKIITVDDDAPADFNNIQAAIDDANDSDIVVVRDGIYRGPGNRDIDFKGKAINVCSENGPETCVIDCLGTDEEPHRGFNFKSCEGPNSVVAGFSIINGYAPESQIGSKITSGGGAIYCFLSSPTITNCVITNNQAGRIGGGICCYHSNCILTNCLITHNSSYDSGGGIYHWLGHITIRNCIIVRNSANHPDSSGGGIVIGGGGYGTIENCTIVENSALGRGCGAGCHDNATITNCIFWANACSQISGNAIVSYSDVEDGYSGTENINVDPAFVGPIIGDYHLSVNSLCINAGDPMYSSEPGEKDIDNETRVINGRVDIGADEVNYEGPIIRTLTTEFKFYANEETPAQQEKDLSVYNNGTGILKWKLFEDCEWLEVDPNDGECTSEIDKVKLVVDSMGLPQDTYHCEIIIIAEHALNSPLTIPVTLHIGGRLFVPSQYETIQAAIDASEDGDKIIVCPGLYNENINFGGKNIILQSIEPKNRSVVSNTIIDGSHNVWGGSIVTFSGTECGACKLSGFTITNGRSTYGCGGGIFGNGTQATIQYSIISENWAGSYSLPSSGFGGGIHNCDGTIQYNTITQNHASGNEGDARGGGLYGCDGTIRNNIISYNSAAGLIGACGGGLSDCQGIIQNNIISYNLVPRFAPGTIPVPGWPPAGWFSGGGLYRCHGTIQNNTIVENVAHSGGGLSNCNGLIRNCIIWGNKDWQIYSSVADVRYSDIEGGYSGLGNIDADPCFVQPGYWDANGISVEGDYHLLSDSPCIDAGDPNYVSEPNEIDLDGRPRVIGGRIDMGAYESPIPAEARITPRTINLAGKGGWITAYLWLPDGFNIDDTECRILLLEYEIEAEQFFVDKQKQVAIARFSREKVQAILDIGEVELSIICCLTDGTVFEGRDVVIVVNKGGKKFAEHSQASHPNPADGATDVSITAELNWAAGFHVISHDVYFGTNTFPPFVCNHTSTTFDPGTMAFDTTYYWRIDEVSKWDITTGLIWSFTTHPPPPRFKASYPNPPDRAMYVSINTDLSWKAGSDATSHDVYFGTSYSPPFVCNQTATTYEPGLMNYSTTYYWRIDEVNMWGKNTGDVWRFTTMMSPPPPPP